MFGWRFRGTYTDEKCEVATAHLSEHPGVAQFIPTLRSEGPLAAYRLLHRMLRECWASSGISISTDSGARADIDREPDPPVQDWFDDEVRAALYIYGKSFDAFAILVRPQKRRFGRRDIDIKSSLPRNSVVGTNPGPDSGSISLAFILFGTS